VTDESASLTEPWVAKHSASYAYAYDKGGKLKRWLGIGPIPHAVLIDATGTIVWRGHPGGLNVSMIEEHLAGTLSKPVYEWPNAAKGVARSLVKGDFAGALAGAKALSEADGGPEVVAQVSGLIDARVTQVEGWLKAGNFLDVLEGGGPLAKGLGDHEHAAKVAAMVAQVEADKQAKPVLEAQKRIRKLRAKDPSKRKEIEAQMEDLEKLRGDMRGTYAAEEAGAYLDQLRAKLAR
jgi:hypothetical protein